MTNHTITHRILDIARIAGDARLTKVERLLRSEAWMTRAFLEGRDALRVARAIAHLCDQLGFETAAHAQRLSAWLALMARQLRLSDESARELELLALVHDVGKLSIEDGVLLTARTLTATELDRIHMHSSLGHAVLFGIDGMQRVAEAVLHHHEYRDGSGYHGKRGTEISRLAQVFIVVDAYESMLRTDRLFRDGVAHDAAIAELTALRGTRYEAEVIDALLAIDVHAWRAVAAEHELAA